MRIYTRAGDDGTTGLFLGGRVSKADVLVDACGDVDEAVAVLGTARASCTDERLAQLIFERQRELFVVAADLATNPAHRDRRRPGISQVTREMVDGLERLIDELVAERPLRPVFIVPGAGVVSAAVDHARTVVRRAERHVVQAVEAGHEVSPLVLEYLNRVSDLVFVVARHAAGEVEEPPSHD
jgi:cob(I)alamin adenosyltransferase